MTGVLIRPGEKTHSQGRTPCDRHTDTQREGPPAPEGQAEVGGMQPRAKKCEGCQLPLGAGGEVGAFPRARPLAPGYWTSSLQNGEAQSSPASQLVVPCYCGHSELIVGSPSLLPPPSRPPAWRLSSSPPTWTPSPEHHCLIHLLFYPDTFCFPILSFFISGGEGFVVSSSLQPPAVPPHPQVALCSVWTKWEKSPGCLLPPAAAFRRRPGEAALSPRWSY